MTTWLLAWLARNAWTLGVFVAFGLVIGAQYVTIQHLQAGIAEQRAVLAGERATAAQAAQIAEAAARAEEHRRTAAQQEALDAAEKRTAQARADAAAAGAAADRLSRRVAALAAEARRAAENPPAAGASAPAGDAAGVLAELQRRADERAGILARIADERGAAGEACERAYDALTAPPVRLRLGDPL